MNTILYAVRRFSAQLEALEVLFGDIHKPAAKLPRNVQAHRPVNAQKNVDVLKAINAIDARNTPIRKMLEGGDWQAARS